MATVSADAILCVPGSSAQGRGKEKETNKCAKASDTISASLILAPSSTPSTIAAFWFHSKRSNRDDHPASLGWAISSLVSSSLFRTNCGRPGETMVRKEGKRQWGGSGAYLREYPIRIQQQLEPREGCCERWEPRPDESGYHAPLLFPN